MRQKPTWIRPFMRHLRLAFGWKQRRIRSNVGAYRRGHASTPAGNDGAFWCTCAPLWVGVLGDSYRNRHWFSTERGHAGVGFSVYRCVIPHCIWCAWVLLWASLFGSFCRNQHCFLIKTAHAGFGFSVYFSAILHAPASSDPPLARAANSRVGKAQGL